MSVSALQHARIRWSHSRLARGSKWVSRFGTACGWFARSSGACAVALLLGACAERTTPVVEAAHDSRGHLAAVRELAGSEGTDSALIDAAREYPDTLRLALSRTFGRITTASTEDEATELAIAYRLADAYARAWTDSFLVQEVSRFERWSPEQRLGRVTADSLRLEGIAAVGRDGVPAAMTLWREALGQLSPVDSGARAAVLASIGGGFYLAGEPDIAIAYLDRSRTLARRL